MFQVILGWSEAWVLLIPLAAYLLIRQQPNFFKLVLILIQNHHVVSFVYELRCPDYGRFSRLAIN